MPDTPDARPDPLRLSPGTVNDVLANPDDANASGWLLASLREQLAARGNTAAATLTDLITDITGGRDVVDELADEIKGRQP
jgi:hypothetical protein